MTSPARRPSHPTFGLLVLCPFTIAALGRALYFGIKP